MQQSTDYGPHNQICCPSEIGRWPDGRLNGWYWLIAACHSHLRKFAFGPKSEPLDSDISMPAFEEIFDPTRPELFLVGFVVMWSLVSYLLSVIGGWSRLAEDYRSERPIEGRRWRFQSASMRFSTAYSNVLTIGASEAGLSLSVLFLFRLGHPPLFIPWSDLRKVGDGGFIMGQRLEISKAPTIALRLRNSLVDRIETARGRSIDQVPEHEI